MAKQTLGVGSVANDGTGDDARAGAQKINANFNEIYAWGGDGSALTALATVATTGAYADLTGTPTIPPVTFETLNAAGDVGSGADQVAAGDHAHAIGDITGLGTGVAAFLAAPSSANLLAAVEDETGTGNLVFDINPTLEGFALNGHVTVSIDNTFALFADGFRPSALWVHDLHAARLIFDGGTIDTGARLADPGDYRLAGWDGDAGAAAYFEMTDGLVFGGLEGARTLAVDDTIARKAVTENPQTGASYTIDLADEYVSMANAGANTVTIPTNASVAFPIGTALVVQQIGAGTTTVEAATGVTLNGVSGGSGDIQAQWGSVSLLKVDINVWRVMGAIGTVA